MNEVAASVLEELVKRGTQRGFLVMSEIQQELEDAEAPAESFDEVFVALQARSIAIREDSSDTLADTALSNAELVHVSDPVRMYLQEIGRYPLLTPQQEVELSLQMEAGTRADEQLDAEGESLATTDEAENGDFVFLREGVEIAHAPSDQRRLFGNFWVCYVGHELSEL